ncbi:CaiB/BaiF CoA transferase family protein [Streptomyces brasiliensis]|uniref:Alpha-methylacyl-CoA racemase n=1 Tax=Streptomyces brasiliensis TaxID=1954 RepID=A0A917P5M0_9ACTN|nr:CaiB/BaiF CoA-transferase family protein [Streptomyces brasiliensis]GGJ62721.1 alpha-methylacyl-CoA racemase [Streptomyces brasiliensis]
MSGPLDGIRVVELAGIGPGPHAAGILAGMGADVLRVARDAAGVDDDPLLHGRRSLVADLRDLEQLERVRGLIDVADVLVEGFRPGVTERLVYARMTGWGQGGPRVADAGHDLNYLAPTGALHAIGRASGRPVPPLNLVADYGGGSMLLLTGVLAALVERAASGAGQVVDVAMIDGVAQLLAPTYAMLKQGMWRDERQANPLDGGLACYDTYTCADGRWVAVGALEPQFWAVLTERLGLDAAVLPDRFDTGKAEELRAVLAEVFARRTRDEWAAEFLGTDGCVTPVLSLEEAADDPQLAARGTLRRRDGRIEAAPAPRFSRTPSPGNGDAALVDFASAETAWPARPAPTGSPAWT